MLYKVYFPKKVFQKKLFLLFYECKIMHGLTVFYLKYY
jgi:hypothetical protein